MNYIQERQLFREETIFYTRQRDIKGKSTVGCLSNLDSVVKQHLKGTVPHNMIFPQNFVSAGSESLWGGI